MEEEERLLPDDPNYKGPSPDEGVARRAHAPWDYALGAYAFGVPAVKTFGAANVIDAGLRAFVPGGEEETPLERKLDIVKPAKVAVKSTRLLYDNLLKNVFDNRILDTRNRHESITRFSTLQKQKSNRDILDQYVWHKAEHGPFKNWQDQGIPQTELSSEISDAAKRTDAQFRTPKPEWTEAAKTGQLADEKIYMQNALADELVFDATGKHISKRKESGYKFLGKFRAEWNRWSKNNNYIHEFADKPSTAYVEHLVGKDKYYDPFWALPNELRFRKGSRHGPYNVRILYNNRMKSFKDASESILKKLHKPKDAMDFILLDWEIDVPPKGSIAVEAAPRDLLVKRVDGTIIGRLGDYHDILYASNNKKAVGEFNTLQYKLGAHKNPRTGKPYIDLTKSQDNIEQQITDWREKIIKDKLQLIIDEEKTLKGMDEASKFQRQSKAVNEDMVNFLTEYAFIKPPEKFEKTFKNQPFSYARGGKPVITKQDVLKDKLQGFYLNKTQERSLIRGKYTGRVPKEIRDAIEENNRFLKNFLDNVMRKDPYE